MGQITILGTSYAVPDQEHGNTHLLVREGRSVILVDCAGDVIQRLQHIDLDPAKITDLIITHFHPDHAAGIPLFLMDLWVMGRKDPLIIRGLRHTIDRIKANMDLYPWQDWPDFFPLNFLPFEAEEFVNVLTTPDLNVIASPVDHYIPTAALRFEFLRSGRSFVFSSDTQPCPAVKRLSREVDILLHEATGEMIGHTSASQAAQIAQKAGAKSLYLIHYPHRGNELDAMLTESRGIFDGPVEIATDFMTLDLN